VRDFEPRQALDGGADGLDFHRRILSEAPGRLRPGGRLFLEIAFDQGSEARRLASEFADFEQVQILKDHAGNERVLTAVKK
jgi:release factor glutamine methyltransferase